MGLAYNTHPCARHRSIRIQRITLVPIAYRDGCSKCTLFYGTLNSPYKDYGPSDNTLRKLLELSNDSRFFCNALYRKRVFIDHYHHFIIVKV